MTISELVNDLENQITNDRAAIEGILETARHSGRETLTRTEDLRAEAIFTRLEQNKRKLASALKVKADEDETDRKSADIRRNPSLPDNYQTRAHVTERTERIGRNGDNRPAHNADTWLRSADGTKATVDRGERFADHAVVRNELNRYAERDRHIIEAHGDFGQWLRAMDTSTQSAVVPTIWASQIVDLARNDAVVMQAGARTVPMSGKVEHVGRLTADAVAYWKGEGSPITPSDLTFDYVEFTAKSMGALCVASVEFMQDAPNAGELIQASIAKAMAAKLDLQCLYGGTPDTDDSGLHLDAVTEPTAGVLTEVTAHAAGNLLGATAVDGTAITVATPFNELLDLVYAPRVLNEESNVLVSNVKMRKRYDSLYTTTQEHAELPATVTNMQWLTTNAVPTFARGAKDHVSDIFGGDFSQVMVGVRLGVQLRFLTERYAENGQVGILAYFRGDIQIPRPAALAVYRFIRSYSA